MASCGHYGLRAVRIKPDSIRRIQLHASVSVPFFQRKHGSYCAKLTRIQSRWPVRVWPDASGLEASRCAGIIWPGFWQDATSPLPVSHFQTRFHSSKHVPDNTVHKPARVRFSSGCSKPVCRNHPARFLAGRNRPATSFPL